MIYYNGQSWQTIQPGSDLPPALPPATVPLPGTGPLPPAPVPPNGFPPEQPGQGGYGIPDSGPPAPGGAPTGNIPGATSPYVQPGSVVDNCSITNLGACWGRVVSFLDAAGLNIAAFVLLIIGVWIMIGPEARSSVASSALKVAA